PHGDHAASAHDRYPAQLSILNARPLVRLHVLRKGLRGFCAPEGNGETFLTHSTFLTTKRAVPSAARAAALIGALALAQWMPAGAQEGHPLKGSWLGTWKSNDTHGENVLLVLDWNG